MTDFNITSGAKIEQIDIRGAKFALEAALKGNAVSAATNYFAQSQSQETERSR